MNVILYTNGKNHATNERLLKKVESAISLDQLEIFQTNKDLVKRANRFPREIDLAVLLAQSDEQLSKLVALKDLLEGVRIILILPNRAKDIVSKGLTLRPRYFSFADSNFVDVAAVLTNMLRNIHSRP